VKCNYQEPGDKPCTNQHAWIIKHRGEVFGRVCHLHKMPFQDGPYWNDADYKWAQSRLSKPPSRRRRPAGRKP
jgi:hypothetical protein